MIVSDRNNAGRAAWRRLAFVGMALLLIPYTLTLPAVAQEILLDADTPASGSLLGSQPLVTAYGTVSFDGEIRDRGNDLEFNTAGASGKVFDIWQSWQWVQFSFDFDVRSVSFIYGGNDGSISVQAVNANGDVVSSFFQGDTGGGQLAGPVNLTGTGIRAFRWTDAVIGNQFCAIDSVRIVVQTVPEPSGLLTLLSAVGGLGGLMCRRRRLAARQSIGESS